MINDDRPAGWMDFSRYDDDDPMDGHVSLCRGLGQDYGSSIPVEKPKCCDTEMVPQHEFPNELVCLTCGLRRVYGSGSTGE